MPMDLMIATGTFALVLAVGIVLMSMGRSDGSRATELLEEVTRLDIDEIGEGLMRQNDVAAATAALIGAKLIP